MADIFERWSERVISEAGVGGFNAMKALSERNEDPKTAAALMIKERDGFVMGAGAGVVILEELEHARAEEQKFMRNCRLRRHGRRLRIIITAPHPKAGC